MRETQHFKGKTKEEESMAQIERRQPERWEGKTVSVESGKQERRELWMEVDIFV